MADIIQVLAQQNPAAAALTDFYVVPAGKVAVISFCSICNQGGKTSFRLSIAVSGAADNAKQYIYYDLPINANDTFIALSGLTLNATDVIRIYAGSANISLNLFGVLN